MSNPLDALEVLNRRARDPDAPRGPYTAADAFRLSIEMRKEANAAAATRAIPGVLNTVGRAAQGLTWDLPQWIGGGIGEVGHHILRGGAAVARKGTSLLGALPKSPVAEPGYLQRAAGALEDLVTYPMQNPGHSLLFGVLGHEAVTNAQRMKAMGQVVKPRGPQGGAFKNIFEPMG